MKICIVRTDRMGDMIMTFPVINGIKNDNNNAIIHVVGSQKNINISKHFPFIDHFILASKSIVDFLKLVKFLRSEKYDYYFNFTPGWYGLILGIFIKSQIKSSLVLKSRYKSNFFSKFLLIQLTKFFFSYYTIINRFSELYKEKNIHQTNIMFSLVNKTGIKITKNLDTDFNFKNLFVLQKNKPICIIHLSYKWLNNYYNEDDFNKLLINLLKKNIFIYLTTDETTKKKFNKIFNKFSEVSNIDQLLNQSDQIIICKDFNFESWVGLISQANYIITPESGCTHIGSLSKGKLCVIYDSDNAPLSIMNEYAPWNKKYLALQTNDLELNKKLLDFIN